MIEIYTTDTCPKCLVVKNLLQRNGLKYREIKLQSQEEKAAFIETFNVRQVPFVIDHGRIIGGAKEATAWLNGNLFEKALPLEPQPPRTVEQARIGG